jgi:hypothetical protein
MKITLTLFFSVSIFSCCFVSCKKAAGPSTAGSSTIITHTLRDSSGSPVVISTDPDDWNLNLTPTPSFTIQETGSFATFITPAYPNPSSDSVSIVFSLSVATTVTFKIFDSNQNLVNVLIDGNHPAGYYLVNWRLDDQLGNNVAPGFYHCTYTWNARVFRQGSNYMDYSDVAVSGSGDIEVQ